MPPSVVFEVSKPKVWCFEIGKHFELNKLEKDTLLSYLNHIHPERLDAFAKELLSSSRSYLEPFIDNDLEIFGEELFNVDYDDIFDESPSGTRLRLVLYNGFVDNIREMDKTKRMEIYDMLGVIFGQDEDKRARRRKLYEGFVAYVKGLDRPGFEKFVSETISPKL